MSGDARDVDEPIEQWPSGALAAAATPAAPPPRGAWWGQVLRGLVFLPVDWRGLRATPLAVALLVAVELAFFAGMERLYVDGAVSPYWPALLQGWFAMAVFAWVAWALARRAHGDPARRPADGAALFAFLLALGIATSVASQLAVLGLHRADQLGDLRPVDAWLLDHAGLGWCLAADLVLFWRLADRRRRALAAWLLGGGAMVAQMSGPGTGYWQPDAPEAPARPTLALSQELFEHQSRLLAAHLRDLRPGRAGAVELYAIAFAPYGDEDVFKREAALVDATMRDRFGADGRSVQLVSNPGTVRELPWATPLNLQRAIERAAAAMNRDEDILFLHLTSHGARNGQLAASLDPLTVDSVTPQQLKAWLDGAGVRHRVISISACYSGSWIAPLADDNTLVMTAADADHTSYGCGRLSELTFFGRAMYAEQLRETRSFEAAHAQAREVIALREKEAGKGDGYSNPQINVGARARAQLEKLERALQR